VTEPAEIDFFDSLQGDLENAGPYELEGIRKYMKQARKSGRLSPSQFDRLLILAAHRETDQVKEQLEKQLKEEKARREREEQEKRRKKHQQQSLF